MVKLLIGGDLVPTKSNDFYFKNGYINNIISKDILELLKNVDYRIMNLETPLTNKKRGIIKEGVKIKSDIDTITGIKNLGIDIVSLANNHILDYGYEGLFDTITALKKNHIKYLGAGDNIKDASKPYVIEKNGIKIGLYAVTEHEFSIADEEKCGANPFDPFDSLDEIFHLKTQVDYVIVLYHGGKEFYRYPTPYLQKVCRKIVDKGANLVICQHSHCIGTFENYKKSKIVYGQGNFIFDREIKKYRDFFKNSLLIELTISKKLNIKINYHVIIKEKEKIRLALPKEKILILKSFYNRNKEITQKNFIKNNYKLACIKQGSRYLLRLSKIGAYLVAIDNRLFNGKIFEHKINLFSLRQRLTLQQMIQCEVHREMVLEYLNNCNVKGKK